MIRPCTATCVDPNPNQLPHIHTPQGGDGNNPDGADTTGVDAEVEPFYALAQRCRLSGMPDMVLEVLNSYRAMASPGALRPGAPRCVLGVLRGVLGGLRVCCVYVY